MRNCCAVGFSGLPSFCDIQAVESLSTHVGLFQVHVVHAHTSGSHFNPCIPHHRCSRKAIRVDYPNLAAWMRDMWQLQLPGFALQVGEGTG